MAGLATAADNAVIAVAAAGTATTSPAINAGPVALPPEATDSIEFSETGEVVEKATSAAPPPTEDGPPNAWPDEAAESAMLSELRGRGETTTAASPATAAAAREAEEAGDTKALPPLDELVKRIPPEVREALDDLFRAKFVRVTKVPKKALKTS